MLYTKLNINKYGLLAATLLMLFFTNLSYPQKIRVLTMNEAISLAEKNNSDLVIAKMDKMKADEIIEKYIKNGEYVEGILPDNYQTIV